MRSDRRAAAASVFDGSPLLRCLAIYGEMPLRFGLTATLFFLVNLALVAQQWLVGRAVHEAGTGRLVVHAADGALDYRRALFWVAVLLGLACARALVQYAAGLLSLSIGQALLTRLRERIMAQIQTLDLVYHWRHGVGEMVTRMTRDADKVRDALINFWRQMFEMAVIFVISSGLLCWYDPLLGLVPLLLVLAGIGLIARQADALVLLDRRVGGAYDAVTQDLSEGVNGVRVIKAFGLQHARIARFEHHVALFRTEARRAVRHAARSVPIPLAVIALGHVWVLGYGATLVEAGRITIGDLVAALLVANTLVLRIEGIGRLLQIIADSRASAARIWEVLDARPEILSGPAALPSGPLGIRFDAVSVSAPGGGAAILRDLSFSVAPGEVVALVGATGTGKSMVTALLPRLIEADRGSIRLGSETAGWIDVRSADQSALRRRVHVLPQESFLFSDTLAANLRLGAPEASDAELRAALELAAAGELLERLDRGLETRVGDRGLTLSGGQRQRVCLARALLSDADILALDDATSALDAVTERRAIESIRSLRRGGGRPLTMLIVSSRLPAVLTADRVLMLGEGRILAEGTHAELVAGNDSYRALMGV